VTTGSHWHQTYVHQTLYTQTQTYRHIQTDTDRVQTRWVTTGSHWHQTYVHQTLYTQAQTYRHIQTDEMGDLRPSDPLDIHTDRHITLADSKLMISHRRRQRQCSKPQQKQTITSTIYSFIHH